MTDSAELPAITVMEIDSADAGEVAAFYDRVLAPHFPPDELEAISGFTAGIKYGGTKALAARTQDGTIIGGAVVDWFEKSRVLLLSYLAVSTEDRGTGAGGKLMRAVTEVWSERFSPELLVMEVEDPRYHHGDVNFGDPEARVRFYERLGARALPIPYFQPALGSLGSQGHRVPHLMLMVFGGTQAPPGTERVDGRIIEVFLTEYLEGCEGQIRPDDTEAQRLLAACRRPGGLPLLRVSELPSFD